MTSHQGDVCSQAPPLSLSEVLYVSAGRQRTGKGALVPIRCSASHPEWTAVRKERHICVCHHPTFYLGGWDSNQDFKLSKQALLTRESSPATHILVCKRHFDFPFCILCPLPAVFTLPLSQSYKSRFILKGRRLWEKGQSVRGSLQVVYFCSSSLWILGNKIRMGWRVCRKHPAALGFSATRSWTFGQDV